MGLLDKFLKVSNKNKYADASTIDESEKKFYKSDDYYTIKANEGTPFEKKVITFEERKKTTFPSSNGLYVGELILLYCCEKDIFPNPETGYPGYLWFRYGIRDVGKALKKLQDEGFIEHGVFKENLQKIKLDKLKILAKKYNIASSQTKSKLVEELLKCEISEQDLSEFIPLSYNLTEKGKKELETNAYIPYMHRHTEKTIEGLSLSEGSFTIWDVNRLLHNQNINEWESIVADFERNQLGRSLLDEKNKEETNNTEQEIKELIKNLQITDEQKENKELGFKEEMEGINCKKSGNYKDALVHFYKAINYKFDAPALYENTAIILRKYKLYEEELEVLQYGLNIAKKNGLVVPMIEDRIQKVKILIEKSNK